MASISFGALPCMKKNFMTARVSMLLKSRASLTCFRSCFLPGRAKDLSAPGVQNCDHPVFRFPQHGHIRTVAKCKERYLFSKGQAGNSNVLVCSVANCRGIKNIAISLSVVRVVRHKSAKTIPCVGLDSPEGSSRLRLPQFLENQHTENVKQNTSVNNSTFMLYTVAYTGWFCRQRSQTIVYKNYWFCCQRSQTIVYKNYWFCRQRSQTIVYKNYWFCRQRSQTIVYKTLCYWDNDLKMKNENEKTMQNRTCS